MHLVGEVNDEGKKENTVSLLKKFKQKRHNLGNKEHSLTQIIIEIYIFLKELLGNEFERSGIF